MPTLHQIYYAWSTSRFGTSDCTIEHFEPDLRHLVVAVIPSTTCAAFIRQPAGCSAATWRLVGHGAIRPDSATFARGSSTGWLAVPVGTADDHSGSHTAIVVLEQHCLMAATNLLP